MVSVLLFFVVLVALFTLCVPSCLCVCLSGFKATASSTSPSPLGVAAVLVSPLRLQIYIKGLVAVQLKSGRAGGGGHFTFSHNAFVSTNPVTIGRGSEGMSV